jgi:hypothetical protein
MKLAYSGENLDEFEIAINDRGFLDLWNKFQNEASNGISYENLIVWQDIFKPLGLTFDFGLDADPLDFELIEAGIIEGNILYLDRVKTWVLEYDIVYHKNGTMSFTRIPIANSKELNVMEHSNKTKINFEIIDKRALIDISTVSIIQNVEEN